MKKFLKVALVLAIALCAATVVSGCSKFGGSGCSCGR